MLTEAEKNLVEHLGDCYGKLCNITAFGPTRDRDLAEAAHHVHALQNMVLAQSAAREYPREYRLLGEVIG